MNTAIVCPLFAGKAPVTPLDGLDNGIDLNKSLIKHQQSTFIVQCNSDAMINAFIPPGARLLVDRSLVPQNGDIILAVVDGKSIIRFLKQNAYKRWLVPANSKYPEMEVTAGIDFKIAGVVTSIITGIEQVRKYMR